MKLSPISVGFYGANRPAFRGDANKTQQTQLTPLTEEAKKDPKKVMEQLLARPLRGEKKRAAFNFCNAWHSRISGGYGSFDKYFIKSVNDAEAKDVAGAIFEIVVNSNLPNKDKLHLLTTIVSEDIFREGETKEGLYSEQTGNIRYRSMLDLPFYFAYKGKKLDEVAKELGATEKLTPKKELAGNNEFFSPSSGEQHWGAGNYDFLSNY